MQRLAQALPGAEVRPVRQIMEGEARVLGKTRSTLLVAAVLIILTAALCVLATLTGWVFDRRRDFAHHEGAWAPPSDWSADFSPPRPPPRRGRRCAWISDWRRHRSLDRRVNFHAPVSPRLECFPVVLAGSMRWRCCRRSCRYLCSGGSSQLSF